MSSISSEATNLTQFSKCNTESHTTTGWFGFSPGKTSEEFAKIVENLTKKVFMVFDKLWIYEKDGEYLVAVSGSFSSSSLNEYYRTNNKKLHITLHVGNGFRPMQAGDLVSGKFKENVVILKLDYKASAKIYGHRCGAPPQFKESDTIEFENKYEDKNIGWFGYIIDQDSHTKLHETTFATFSDYYGF